VSVRAKPVEVDGRGVVSSEEPSRNGGHDGRRAKDKSGLAELLWKAQIEHEADFLKEGVRILSQALMQMEVQEHVGASRHERSPGRTGQHNGYR
jgi:transposase-like protein